MTSFLRFAVAALAAALTLAPAFAAETHTWTADPNHSTAQFTATHFGISHVNGYIPIKSATIETGASPALPTKISATLDPAGIDTRQPDRDGDLRSPHFFDVAQYPAMTFESTSIAATGDKTFDVTGNLTMHGVTKPVTLKTTFLGQMTDSRGRTHGAYEGTATIKRSDWGMTYGPVIVNDEVALTIDIEAILRP